MSKKPPCPRCTEPLERKAIVDSHDRIWQRWRYCPGCNYDERYSLTPHQKTKGES